MVLATGRSGADLLSKLAPTLPVTTHIRRCDVGVRLEFPYTCWPDLPRDDWPRIGVFGPEFDYYWPTMTVHADFRTDVDRLYLIGDGTGRFRGILQAFASGLHLGSSLQKEIHDAT